MSTLKAIRSKRKQQQSSATTDYSRALSIPQGIGPILPDACVASLRWHGINTLTNDGTTAWTIGNVSNYRINNAFEPLSGGHQPYGWDQMAALYRYYKVIGCTMKFTVMTAQSSSNAIFFIRPVPVNENATMEGTHLNFCSERPGTQAVHLQPGGGIPPSRTLNIDIPRLLGVSAEQFRADVSLYSAAVTAAPSRYAYVQIGMCGSATSAVVSVHVEISYKIQYWQRITLATS